MLSLQRLIERETLGQRSRFERFAADMLYFAAAGKQIDTDRTPRFADQLESVFKNPFEKAEKKMTAEEIRQYTLNKIRGLLANIRRENNGTDETRCETAAG